MRFLQYTGIEAVPGLKQFSNILLVSKSGNVHETLYLQDCWLHFNCELKFSHVSDVSTKALCHYNFSEDVIFARSWEMELDVDYMALIAFWNCLIGKMMSCLLGKVMCYVFG